MEKVIGVVVVGILRMRSLLAEDAYKVVELSIELVETKFVLQNFVKPALVFLVIAVKVVVEVVVKLSMCSVVTVLTILVSQISVNLVSSKFLVKVVEDNVALLPSDFSSEASTTSTKLLEGYRIFYGKILMLRLGKHKDLI